MPVKCWCGSHAVNTSGEPYEQPEPEILQAIPYDDWPLWARTVAALQTDADMGVGDTFERIAASMGGVAFKAWAKAAGIDCGCDARKASWNVLYPYG